MLTKRNLCRINNVLISLIETNIAAIKSDENKSYMKNVTVMVLFYLQVCMVCFFKLSSKNCRMMLTLIVGTTQKL